MPLKPAGQGNPRELQLALSSFNWLSSAPCKPLPNHAGEACRMGVICHTRLGVHSDAALPARSTCRQLTPPIKAAARMSLHSAAAGLTRLLLELPHPRLPRGFIHVHQASRQLREPFGEGKCRAWVGGVAERVPVGHSQSASSSSAHAAGAAAALAASFQPGSSAWCPGRPHGQLQLQQRSAQPPAAARTSRQ